MDFSEESRDAILNRIVFKNEKTGVESGVECSHMAIYQATSEEVLGVAMDVILKQTGNQLPGEPVRLPPEEHFVALRSYVAALAEAGIETLIRQIWSWKEDMQAASLPFGFNAAMQSQILQALRIVGPSACRALRRDVFLELLDSAPREWVFSRLPILISSGNEAWEEDLEYTIQTGQLDPGKKKLILELYEVYLSKGWSIYKGFLY